MTPASLLEHMHARVVGAGVNGVNGREGAGVGVGFEDPEVEVEVGNGNPLLSSAAAALGSNGDEYDEFVDLDLGRVAACV